MVWHVHYKDGKFAVWSTIVDAYVTNWTDEKGIIDEFKKKAIEEAEDQAKTNIKNAKQNRCSVEYFNWRCEKI